MTVEIHKPVVSLIGWRCNSFFELRGERLQFVNQFWQEMEIDMKPDLTKQSLERLMLAGCQVINDSKTNSHQR
jgi:hypothetical protein